MSVWALGEALGDMELRFSGAIAADSNGTRIEGVVFYCFVSDERRLTR